MYRNERASRRLHRSFATEPKCRSIHWPGPYDRGPRRAQGNGPRPRFKTLGKESRAKNKKKLRKGGVKAVKSLARITLCAGLKSRAGEGRLRWLTNEIRLGSGVDARRFSSGSAQRQKALMDAPRREQPANPDRWPEKRPEGQPCFRVEPIAPKAAKKHGAESRQRANVDGDRQIDPAQPHAGDRGELDVAEADSRSSPHSPVARAKGKKQDEHEACANESLQDRDRRRRLRPQPGRDETCDEGQPIQFIGDDHPAMVDDGDRQHQSGKNGAGGAAPSRRRGEARQDRAGPNGADKRSLKRARARQTIAEAPRRLGCHFAGRERTLSMEGKVSVWVRPPRIFERSASATIAASAPLRMICGRMKMMSSVRLPVVPVVPNAAPI